MTGTALRRTVMLALFAVGVGAVLSWWRGQATTPTPAQPPQWPPLPQRPPDAAATASAPAAASDTTGPVWLPGNDDGSAPPTHPVKVKESSGIFHVPGGRFYDRTKPDRCYPTAVAAEADGYRQSKT